MNDIRLMQERAARLAALEAAIARGLADADAGRVKPASEVFDRSSPSTAPRQKPGAQ
jgi:antitoxin ParD1/3/4